MCVCEREGEGGEKGEGARGREGEGELDVGRNIENMPGEVDLECRCFVERFCVK